MKQLFILGICFLTLITATQALNSYWTPTGFATQQPCPQLMPPSPDFCPQGQITPNYDSRGCITGYSCKSQKTCPPMPIPSCLAGSELQKETDLNGCLYYSCKPRRACTEEAKICPDRTAVSRTGPNCEFAPCPGEGYPTCGNGVCEPGEGSNCPPCAYAKPPCPTFIACREGSCPQDCRQTPEEKECKVVFSSCSCSYRCVEIDPNNPAVDCMRACLTQEINPRKPNCSYVNGICQEIGTNQKCAKEGEYSSGPVSPEYATLCCPGLEGFNTRGPDIVGAGSLCYDPTKGKPECRSAGTRSEGWYYSSSGKLLRYENCDKTETCKNLCGDGVCQEVVCMAIGCPCAETPESCPQDCKKTTSCGNGVCEEGEDNWCPPCTKSVPPCMAPCRRGTCLGDCIKNNKCPSPETQISCDEGTKLKIEKNEKGCPTYSCVPATGCTLIYQPVCGLVHVQCIRAPCPPMQQTFSNRCELEKNHLAEFLHEGPCEANPCPEVKTTPCPPGTRQIKQQDKNNCPRFTCEEIANSTCTMPTCQPVIATGQYYQNGCPIYKCGPEIKPTEGRLRRIINWLSRIFG